MTQTEHANTHVSGGGKWKNDDFPDFITSVNVDTRNVIDHYKHWSVEAIREDLDATRTNVNLVAENFAHDFNIATLVRNANAFNANSVTIVGRRKWDRRGAVGSYTYMNMFHERDAESFYQSITEKGYPLIVMDNIEGSQPLPTFQWPEGELYLVLGQESIGVSNLALQYATHCVEIPQMGSVRSLNVGVCSGIVLYDYMVKSSLT